MPLELMGFPSNSAGKKSSCNAEDPGSIPGLGRSTGEGTSYYPSILGLPWWAQMVKKPPAMWETSVRSLGWEDPWRKKWLPTPVF